MINTKTFIQHNNKLTKRIFTAMVFMFLFNNLFAQFKVGDNQGTINPSAALEIESKSKGFLLPRLTTAEMNTIITPANGLMIYNLSDSCIYVFRAAAGWKSTCNFGDASAWNLKGNSNATDSSFIGTTNKKALIFKTDGNEAMRIATDGKIGIGNGNPIYALDVKATKNPVRFQGVGVGAADDYILTDSAGVVRHRSIPDIIQNSDAWLNGGNKLKASGQLGTITNQSFSLITNGIPILTFGADGSITQIGKNKVTLTGNVDAKNGLNVSGDVLNATSGANLEGKTTINTTGTSVTSIGNPSSTTNIDGTNLNVKNLPKGSGTEQVVVVDPTDGKVKQVDLASIGSNSITADNGLTKNVSNISLGGKLIKNTVIEQDGNNLSFINGKLGIGTSTPTSTVVIAGSLSQPIRNTIKDLAVSEKDYTILANCTKEALTLTLPDAALSIGRTYLLIKSDESTNKLTVFPALRLTETTYLPSINYSSRLYIQSDGIDWWVINLR